MLIASLRHTKKVFKLDEGLWDAKTLTAQDYTIEFDIPRMFYQGFISKHGSNKPEGISMAVYFREWLTTQFKQKLL